MDYSKIFLKEAVPTSIGGQAVMEGVMMRSADRTGMAVRLPDGEIYLKTEKNAPAGRVSRIPLVRGCVSFFKSLVVGMKTLTDSADVLEQFMPEEENEEDEEPGWFVRKFGEQAAWNLAIAVSMVIAIVVAVALFAVFPTVAVNWLSGVVHSSVLLNLIEGIFRMALFVLYIAAISRMEDIKTLFRYHGAEHKTIHCFENGLELTPANAQQFCTLHPRCGTSFVMFVFIISLLLFSFLGWPNALMRILSRIVLIPVIAGISYELLKWAGRSDNIVIRILSTPGLLLQKLTTNEPSDAQLEIAIVALRSVLVPEEEPEVEAIVDKDNNIIKRVMLALRGKSEEEPENWEEDDEEEVVQAGGGGESLNRKASDLNFEVEVNPRSVAGVIQNGAKTLQKAGKPNAKHDATEIFCYAMGFSHNDIVIRAKESVFADDIREYNRLIDLRKNGTPLQYITKVQGFMGLLFRVNENVLIPRQDTEVLVEQVIGMIEAKRMAKPKILDMCTGSGAIGVSLAHEIQDSEVTMSDISADAISVAIDNAEMNGVFKRCMFLIGDMFEALPENKKYDVMVCNPPYIREDVINTLDTEVKDHEPRLALDGGDDGLKFYRSIAYKAGAHLESEGVLALEIGYDQADDVKDLLEKSGDFERVAVVKDLAGLDRVVIAERK